MMEKIVVNKHISASIERQRQLLKLEYEAEKQSFSELSDKIGIWRLVERGNAWFPIKVERTYYNSLNRRVVEIFRYDNESEIDHSFEYGRPVIFFTIDGDPLACIQRKFPGTVSFVDSNRMVIEIDDNTDLTTIANNTAVGVILSFDETTYTTMFRALDAVASAKGRLAQLRDIIYSKQPVGRLKSSPITFPYLNTDQQKAVNNILTAKDIAIVHGPPGTGKTTTLVEAIYETLRRETQVLVCAQSNMAVDWISEKLVDRGVNVLRIGNPTRVNDKMLSYTYERLFEAHPDYTTLWSIRKAIREMYNSRHVENRHQKIERLKDRATELEIKIKANIIGNARVIACTLVGSASRVLEGINFSTLFIDEAAQALEAACWIAIRRSARVVLAGDHCQLPPTVKCYEAQKQGLGISLMERAVQTHPEAVSLLTLQYRMHKDIMQFSSNWFYGGKMQAASIVSDHSILSLDTPIEWIDTGLYESNADDNIEPIDDFTEQITKNSRGRINPAEARLTVEILESYINRIGSRRIIDENIDIGIISPYRAQAIYLRRLVSRNHFFKPIRRQIAINTVDGFQGQERDVIVLSLVRSNSEGTIGFLSDLRRMNVAMTRARKKLIIIGSASTLSVHPFYRRLVSYINSLNDHL